ncbi:MAG: hypothetical protein J6M92_06000 [Oribacterium sp.]|nr:hypothetical protein [Oribacterium sp.]
MKPVDRIPIACESRTAVQESRRNELQEFWTSGVKYAELTIFNPKGNAQLEIDNYKRVAHSLGLASSVELCSRKGKVYIQRR